MKTLNSLSLFFLLLLVLVSWIASFTQDVLLFQTDGLNLLMTFTVLAGLLFGMVLPVLGPLLAFLSKSKSKRLDRFLSCLIFSLLLSGALLHWVDTGVVFNFFLNDLEKLLNLSGKAQTFLLAAGLVVLLCLALAVALSRVVDLTDRLVLLSRAVVLGSIFLIAGFTLSRTTGAVPEKSPNAIVIIMDGLSTKFLEPYNPEESTPDFTAMAKRSLLFTNIRTNYAYTQGFFNTFYSGTRADTGLEVEKPRNLFSVLQEGGINTRWFSFHNNGVPDIQRFHYKGLRSLFLVREAVGLPRILGMDYNLFRLEGGGWRGRSVGYREMALREWLIARRERQHEAPLQSQIPEEIESLRQDSRPFFLLVHLPISALAQPDITLKMWQREERNRVAQSRKDRVLKKILAGQDYAYSPEDEDVIAELREKNRQYIRLGTNSLKRFVDHFFEKGWDRDTLLMVTADHGKIFSGGHYAYGFHHEEEVTRVPLIMFWNRLTGKDPRLGESIDLTQTLLEFFNVNGKLSSDALSLLAPAEKERVATLTRKSNKRHEWFLNVYQNEKRFVLNLYPENFSIRQERFTGTFDTRLEQKGEGAMKELGTSPAKLAGLFDLPVESLAAEARP